KATYRQAYRQTDTLRRPRDIRALLIADRVLPRTPFTVPESLDPNIVRSAILDQSVLHAEPVADVTTIVTSRMNEL
ncbi:MAG: hypothetical protein VXW42_08480, partial [Planctomycetota bacterium]|nr:hypothetical protein [Planctomycetota bacterium]